MKSIRAKATAACVALAMLAPLSAFATKVCQEVSTTYVIASAFGVTLSVTVTSSVCTG